MKEVPIDEAWQKKYPEQLVFVVSSEAHGTPNIMTAGWCMPAMSKPPGMCIAIEKSRYTRKLISETKEFVIAFPSETMEKEVLFCGQHSGSSVDKFKETGLETHPAKKVHPPLLTGCVANFECSVLNETPIGSHVLFIGEILTAHACEEGKKRLYNFGNLCFKGIPGNPQ